MRRAKAYLLHVTVPDVDANNEVQSHVIVYAAYRSRLRVFFHGYSPARVHVAFVDALTNDKQHACCESSHEPDPSLVF